MNAAPYCLEHQFISREQALQEHIENLGEDPQKFLGYNPLTDAFEIRLCEQYAVADSITVIEHQLRSLPYVNNVLYQQDVVKTLDHNLNEISVVLLLVALALLVIALVLISKTIQLQVYSKRFIINTMRLVGATPWVIKKPFVKRNVLMGLQASIIALVAIFVTIYACYYRLGIMLIPITLENILIVTSAILSIGVLLTFLTSLFATGKYVRMKVDKMYEI
jgi:cell division transport system permease protein